MKIAIFGASGFAREVRDIAYVLGYKNIVFIDKKTERSIDGFPIVSEKKVNSLAEKDYHFIIGIGNPEIRKEIKARYHDLKYINLVHPSATFGFRQLAELEKRVGNVICAGTRMTSNIRLGNFGVYYLNCTIPHDCVIEDFVTISSGVNISGNVKISTGAYIGTNACILQGKSLTDKLVVGRNTIVGAGSVVTKSVPENTIVKGIPAR
ncbi:acetyltransferase [Alteribacillus bidgolensis]|uniref:Sugar O-acyltransferase, sialic acid O-acetyltransferase NeuD family n=1 Tax=Alteribacillus bidgolensis TaxID=930129 RepID=A0A1G8JJ84_9BACI|nr:acetyltransferase [Alteribacillus bidgolensis]SDI30700.1 sugar O-acyltransferase, sialic acid O-acetyltransferase NeuD family [Alteribacillus bidgolensis]